MLATDKWRRVDSQRILLMDRESANGKAALDIHVVKPRPSGQNSSHATPGRHTSHHARPADPLLSAKLIVPRKTRAGWALLLEGYDYCESLGRDLWDFAVDIQSLRRAGLTNNTLRWMICQGWLSHADELPSSDAPARVFRGSGLLTFGKATCFVLTVSGVDAARQVCQDFEDSRTLAAVPLAEHSQPRSTHRRGTSSSFRPLWNPELQQLCVGDVLIKEFKLPCPNQGTILMAFEEEGWPSRIDDPLPPSGEMDPRTRLRYTIKSLNKKQKTRLIRFIGDGTGMGVRWEFLANAVFARSV
jgi:hypothetical protein